MKKIKGLAVQRIINFLRYIREDQDVLAVKLVNEELDKGADLVDLLKKEPGGSGYSLGVKKISEDVYKIKFECVAGPDAGDGGEWIVRYDSSDNVVACDSGLMWIS